MKRYRNDNDKELGAVYVSAGRFAEAIETAQKALKMVNPNQKNLMQTIRSRLEL